MKDERSGDRDTGAAEEPALTQKNSATVRGEETLADTGTVESNQVGDTSTHTKLGTIPSSYGAAGGTTDAYEEGAGEHGEGKGSGT